MAELRLLLRTDGFGDHKEAELLAAVARAPGVKVAGDRYFIGLPSSSADARASGEQKIKAALSGTVTDLPRRPTTFEQPTLTRGQKAEAKAASQQASGSRRRAPEARRADGARPFVELVADTTLVQRARQLLQPQSLDGLFCGVCRDVYRDGRCACRP